MRNTARAVQNELSRSLGCVFLLIVDTNWSSWMCGFSEHMWFRSSLQVPFFVHGCHLINKDFSYDISYMNCLVVFSSFMRGVYFVSAVSSESHRIQNVFYKRVHYVEVVAITVKPKSQSVLVLVLFYSLSTFWSLCLHLTFKLCDISWFVVNK